MGRRKKYCEQNDTEEVVAMTDKENVLSSYPKAKLVKTPEKNNQDDRDRWNNEYYLVSWEEQTVEQFMRAYSDTEEGAWSRAWSSVQKEMLTQLENL
jgi:hypothetical protein